MLTALLTGSVIFNVFVVSRSDFELHSIGAEDKSNATGMHDSGRDLIPAAIRQEDALRLQQIADLKKDISLHLSTVAKLRREHALILKRNIQIERRLALTGQQLATSQEKLAITTEAARRVGNSTTIRVRSSIKRQFATAPSKLVPFLGNGVAIGSFGYDVYELCASMSDLANLNRAIGEPAGNDDVIATMCRTGTTGF